MQSARPAVGIEAIDQNEIEPMARRCHVFVPVPDLDMQTSRFFWQLKKLPGVQDDFRIDLTTSSFAFGK